MNQEVTVNQEPEVIDYNNIPVHYCKHCLYLGNPNETTLLNTVIEFCPHCGSTDFEDSHIEEWEKKFEETYKQGKFLNIKKSWRKIMEDKSNQ